MPPSGSPGARGGWLEAGLQRKIGWTGTTLRVGYAEAEESWCHPGGRAVGWEEVEGRG